MKCLLSLCSIALLSGCVGDVLESSTPAPVRYVIHPMQNDLSFASDTVIRIDKVLIDESLETDRIAVLEDNRRLHFLEQAHWAASLDNVWERYLTASLDSVDKAIIVQQDAVHVKADYRLRADISDVYVLYDALAGQGVPHVRTSGMFMLLNAKDNSIVTSMKFEKESEARSNSATDVSEAFERQWGEIMQEFTQKLVNITAQ